jgi:hypothetical protein
MNLEKFQAAAIPTGWMNSDEPMEKIAARLCQSGGLAKPDTTAAQKQDSPSVFTGFSEETLQKTSCQRRVIYLFMRTIAPDWCRDKTVFYPKSVCVCRPGKGRTVTTTNWRN